MGLPKCVCGSAQGPRWENLQRSPDPLAGLGEGEGRGREEMGADTSGGGRRHGKERVREVRGEEDRGGQGKGGERKRKGTKKRKEEREGMGVPPVLNSQFKHCALVHVTSQRREQ